MFFLIHEEYVAFLTYSETKRHCCETEKCCSQVFLAKILIGTAFPGRVCTDEPRLLIIGLDLQATLISSWRIPLKHCNYSSHLYLYIETYGTVTGVGRKCILEGEIMMC